MDEFIALFTTDSHSDLFLTCAIVGGLILSPLAAEVRRRAFNPWQLKNIFLIFILLQFCIWPLIMYIPRNERLYTTEVRFWTTGYGTFVRGQYYVIAGILAFYLGYYGRQAPPPKSSRPRWIDRAPAISDRQYASIFWTCVAITAVSFGAMMVSSGGLLYFLQNIDLLRTTEGAGWGIFLFPIMACQVGITLYTAWSMEQRRSLLLPLLGGFLQLACSFVIGIRMLMIAPIACFVLCYHFHVKPIRITWKMSLALVFFLFFNMWYGIFRGTGSLDPSLVTELPAGLFLLGLFGRFHGGESMSRIIEGTDRMGFHYGLLNLQDFVFSFVPRILMPNKPTSLGITVNVTFWPENFTLDDTGSAVPTLFGEMYWALGIPAILLALYLHGVVYRRVERETLLRSPVQTNLYCSFFVYSFFANEVFSVQIFQLFFRILCLAGLLWVVRLDRSRVPHRAPLLDASGEPA